LDCAERGIVAAQFFEIPPEAVAAVGQEEKSS
jgi:hypothetical protein